MPAFLVQYEIVDKAPIYPEVVSFLSTNAQGKSDVFFTVMQLALESYTALGFNVPKSKANAMRQSLVCKHLHIVVKVLTKTLLGRVLLA